jgi:phage-related protein
MKGWMTKISNNEPKNWIWKTKESKHTLFMEEREKKDTSTDNKLSIIRCHMPHQKEEDAVMLART